jgi:hypothetical protein
LLDGLSVSRYDIDSEIDILGQFSHFPDYIREREVAGGGWFNFFSYLLLSGSVLLGSGSTNYLKLEEYDDVGLLSGEFHFSVSVSVSLRFIIADLPILSGPPFLLWGLASWISLSSVLLILFVMS